MEKLIKTALGQWKLVTETLRKAPEDDAPKPVAPPAPTPEAPSTLDHGSLREANKKHLSSLFTKMNAHAAANRHEDADKVKGEIKDFALTAPKGSVDIGHLGELRENSLKTTRPARWEGGPHIVGRPMRDNDLAEIINHHVGDAKSLKDIYQNHGGEKTLRAMLHVNGANGTPMADYAPLKFKNPSIHADIQDLVNPGKGDQHREDNRHKGVLPKAYFSKTEFDPELHRKVDETYNKMLDANWEAGSDTSMKNHQNAVVDRGVEMFKRHHKLS